MKKLAYSSMLAGLLLFSTAQAAETKPVSTVDDTVLKNGQKSAMFCRHCHGVGGYSVRQDTPNLAGQNEAYLLEQMNKFATGRRKNEFMEGLIKALTPEERTNIALYFSRQPAPAQPVKNTRQVEAGKNLYAKLCISCHGMTGSGTEKIPRVAGQHAAYLQQSLKRYRSGSGERIDLQMAAFTRNLKDADIVNLSAYISSLK